MPPRAALSPPYIVAILVALLAAILVLDILTPRGMADSMLYMAPVLTTLWLPQHRSAFVVAALGTFLAILGFILSPPNPDVSLEVVALNRAFSIVGIWLAAFLVAERNQIVSATSSRRAVPLAWATAILGSLLAMVFFLDEVTPEDTANEMLYVVPVLATLFLPLRHAELEVVGVAGIATLLTVLSSLLVSPHAIPTNELLNHTYAMVVIWVAAILTMERNRLTATLKRANETLESRVAERNRELSESYDLVRAEMDAHRRTQEQHREFLESAPDGILVVGQDGRIEYVNKAIEDIFGYQRTEILGKGVEALVPAERRNVHVLHRRGFVQSPHRRAMGTAENIHGQRKDGSHFPVDIMLNPAESSQGLKVVATLRDVTEKRRVDEELRETNHRLQQTLQELQEAQSRLVHQERLNALGQMASGIVHDFNNALTPIVGFLGLILDNPNLMDDKPKLLEYLRQCQSSAADASAIISRLREFYRPREQTEPLVPTDVNQVMQHAMSVTEYAWRHQAVRQGIPIRVTPDLRPVPAILGQGQELGRVLTNLILNAVDAMPQGGAITLRTRQQQQRVLLEVTDTGTGMPEEVRRHCFEPFFTTKGEKGTGLGLAVAYGVIQRHNGRIDVESEPGKGTTFRIHLPVA